MSASTSLRMTAAEYVRWSAGRPAGERHELVDGEVIAMAPEQFYHSRVKGRVFRRLEEAVEAAGLGCDVAGDGLAVQIGDGSVYEPDVAVLPSGTLDKTAVLYSHPLIVVEVLSPSSQALNTGVKLAGYFSLTSVLHYLIIRLDKPSVIHHARSEDAIQTRIVASGPLRLQPPGITLDVGSLFP